MIDYEDGDHVIIGDYGKVHWMVHSTWRLDSGEQVLILKSPMSGRTETQLARYVSLFKRGTEANPLATEL